MQRPPWPGVPAADAQGSSIIVVTKEQVACALCTHPAQQPSCQEQEANVVDPAPSLRTRHPPVFLSGRAHSCLLALQAISGVPASPCTHPWYNGLFVFECHSTNVCHSCTRAGQSQQAAHGFTGSVRRRVRSDSNNHRRRATKCDTRRPPSALDPHEQNQPSKV